MFAVFDKSFRPDDFPPPSNEYEGRTFQWRDSRVREICEAYGGRSFNGGIYRILRAADVARWNDQVERAFPSSSGQITCFGMDWLGRIFAADASRSEGGHSGVSMFQPGTGEVLEIPCDVDMFHQSELIEYCEEALAESFYRSWISSGGGLPAVDQCVGYKIPLFLGGVDDVQNLELCDLDVYWTISEQLIGRVRNGVGFRKSQ